MGLLDIAVKPDFEALRRNILRQGTPQRVHYVELFQDVEIKNMAVQRFDLAKGLDTNDPFFALRREIALQRFLGYDMIRVFVANFGFKGAGVQAEDTATPPGQKRARRNWHDEHRGPIQSWEDFEKYPWPDPAKADCSVLEWVEKNLPDDMAAYALTSHILEQPAILMGYETLCYKLCEEPDLAEAVFRKCGEIWTQMTRIFASFSRVGVIWGSDDMGFKTQTLISADDLRRLCLPWHKKAAQIAHDHGKLYFLHSCGNLKAIMEDLIEGVKIDARHSYEDVIEPAAEAKRAWGGRIAILGGIDVDFLARADEAAIRRRVRETLGACMPGGGYCLGSGNSVANYIPLENYLVMLDEGRHKV